MKTQKIIPILVMTAILSACEEDESSVSSSEESTATVETSIATKDSPKTREVSASSEAESFRSLSEVEALEGVEDSTWQLLNLVMLDNGVYSDNAEIYVGPMDEYVNFRFSDVEVGEKIVEKGEGFSIHAHILERNENLAKLSFQIEIDPSKIPDYILEDLTLTPPVSGNFNSQVIATRPLEHDAVVGYETHERTKAKLTDATGLTLSISYESLTSRSKELSKPEDLFNQVKAKGSFKYSDGRQIDAASLLKSYYLEIFQAVGSIR